MPSENVTYYSKNGNVLTTDPLVNSYGAGAEVTSNPNSGILTVELEAPVSGYTKAPNVYIGDYFRWWDYQLILTHDIGVNVNDKVPLLSGEHIKDVSNNKIITAFYDDENPTGFAYIWNIDGTNPIKLVASDIGSIEGYGWSAGIDAKAVVGTFEYDSGRFGATIRGYGAYVYDLDGTNEIKLLSTDYNINDAFGFSVAIRENVIAVGAPRDNSATGAVYLFDLDGNQLTKITASDGAANDHFGANISIGNGKIAISSPYDHNENGTDAGAVYVYDIDGNNEFKIIASDGEALDYFGGRDSQQMTDDAPQNSVSIGGNKIVVACPKTGNGYIYDLDGTNEIKFTTSHPSGITENIHASDRGIVSARTIFTLGGVEIDRLPDVEGPFGAYGVEPEYRDVRSNAIKYSGDDESIIRLYQDKIYIGAAGFQLPREVWPEYGFPAIIQPEGTFVAADLLAYYVGLLMRFNGADGDTTFVDESYEKFENFAGYNPKIITGGSIQLSSDQAKFGSTSLWCPMVAQADYIQIDMSVKTNPTAVGGSLTDDRRALHAGPKIDKTIQSPINNPGVYTPSDFTYELWVYHPSVTGVPVYDVTGVQTGTVTDIKNSDPDMGGIYIYKAHSRYISPYRTGWYLAVESDRLRMPNGASLRFHDGLNGVSFLTRDRVLFPDQWHHIAVSRINSEFKIYVDGVAQYLYVKGGLGYGDPSVDIPPAYIYNPDLDQGTGVSDPDNWQENRVTPKKYSGAYQNSPLIDDPWIDEGTDIIYALGVRTETSYNNFGDYYIGNFRDSTSALHKPHAYIDDIRISGDPGINLFSGSGDLINRYPFDFTPPTATYPGMTDNYTLEGFEIIDQGSGYGELSSDEELMMPYFKVQYPTESDDIPKVQAIVQNLFGQVTKIVFDPQDHDELVAGRYRIMTSNLTGSGLVIDVEVSDDFDAGVDGYNMLKDITIINAGKNFFEGVDIFFSDSDIGHNEWNPPSITTSPGGLTATISSISEGTLDDTVIISYDGGDINFTAQQKIEIQSNGDIKVWADENLSFDACGSFDIQGLLATRFKSQTGPGGYGLLTLFGSLIASNPLPTSQIFVPPWLVFYPGASSPTSITLPDQITPDLVSKTLTAYIPETMELLSIDLPNPRPASGTSVTQLALNTNNVELGFGGENIRNLHDTIENLQQGLSSYVTKTYPPVSGSKTYELNQSYMIRTGGFTFELESPWSGYDNYNFTVIPLGSEIGKEDAPSLSPIESGSQGLVLLGCLFDVGKKYNPHIEVIDGNTISHKLPTAFKTVSTSNPEINVASSLDLPAIPGSTVDKMGKSLITIGSNYISGNPTGIEYRSSLSSPAGYTFEIPTGYTGSISVYGISDGESIGFENKISPAQHGENELYIGTNSTTNADANTWATYYDQNENKNPFRRLDGGFGWSLDASDVADKLVVGAPFEPDWRTFLSQSRKSVLGPEKYWDSATFPLGGLVELNYSPKSRLIGIVYEGSEDLRYFNAGEFSLPPADLTYTSTWNSSTQTPWMYIDGKRIEFGAYTDIIGIPDTPGNERPSVKGFPLDSGYVDIPAYLITNPDPSGSMSNTANLTSRHGGIYANNYTTQSEFVWIWTSNTSGINSTGTEITSGSKQWQMFPGAGHIQNIGGVNGFDRETIPKPSIWEGETIVSFPPPYPQSGHTLFDSSKNVVLNPPSEPVVIPDHKGYYKNPPLINGNTDSLLIYNASNILGEAIKDCIQLENQGAPLISPFSTPGNKIFVNRYGFSANYTYDSVTGKYTIGQNNWGSTGIPPRVISVYIKYDPTPVYDVPPNNNTILYWELQIFFNEAWGHAYWPDSGTMTVKDFGSGGVNAGDFQISWNTTFKRGYDVIEGPFIFLQWPTQPSWPAAHSYDLQGYLHTGAQLQAPNGNYPPVSTPIGGTIDWGWPSNGQMWHKFFQGMLTENVDDVMNKTSGRKFKYFIPTFIEDSVTTPGTHTAEIFTQNQMAGGVYLYDKSTLTNEIFLRPPEDFTGTQFGNMVVMGDTRIVVASAPGRNLYDSEGTNDDTENITESAKGIFKTRSNLYRYWTPKNTNIALDSTFNQDLNPNAESILTNAFMTVRPYDSVFVYDTSGNLIKEIKNPAPIGFTTTLVSDIYPGDTTITLNDTSGLFVPLFISSERTIPGGLSNQGDFNVYNHDLAPGFRIMGKDSNPSKWLNYTGEKTGNTLTLAKQSGFYHPAGSQVIQSLGNTHFGHTIAIGTNIIAISDPAAINPNKPAKVLGNWNAPDIASQVPWSIGYPYQMTGAVYIYDLNGNLLNTIYGENHFDEFGVGLDIDPNTDTVYVGAPGYQSFKPTGKYFDSPYDSYNASWPWPDPGEFTDGAWVNSSVGFRENFFAYPYGNPYESGHYTGTPWEYNGVYYNGAYHKTKSQTGKIYVYNSSGTLLQERKNPMDTGEVAVDEFDKDGPAIEFWYADGFSSNGATVPSNVAFQIGNNDFCMEAWIRGTQSGIIAAQWGSTSTSGVWKLEVASEQLGNYIYGENNEFYTGDYTNWKRSLIFTYSESGVLTSNDWDSPGSSLVNAKQIVAEGALYRNGWQHIAITRNSTGTRLFVDGVLVKYDNRVYNLPNPVEDFSMGGSYGNDAYAGHISNFRFVNGSIPTEYQTTSTTIGDSIFSPDNKSNLTSITNTKLLTFQDSTFIDNGPGSYTITPDTATMTQAYFKYYTHMFDRFGQTISVPKNSPVDFENNTGLSTEDWSIAVSAPRSPWGYEEMGTEFIPVDQEKWKVAPYVDSLDWMDRGCVQILKIPKDANGLPIAGEYPTFTAAYTAEVGQGHTYDPLDTSDTHRFPQYFGINSLTFEYNADGSAHLSWGDSTHVKSNHVSDVVPADGVTAGTYDAHNTRGGFMANDVKYLIEELGEDTKYSPDKYKTLSNKWGYY